MVDKELIAEIKNSVNIVEVIGEVVSLTKAGRNFWASVLFMVKRLLPLMSLKTSSLPLFRMWSLWRCL